MKSPSDLLSIAERLGTRLKRVSTTEHCGPCPKCGGQDRFSVNVKRGVFNCRGCNTGGDAVALVRHVTGCTYREALEFVGDERAGLCGKGSSDAGPLRDQPSQPDEVETDDAAQRIHDAVALFRESIDPVGTIVERYFASRRLTLGDLGGRVIRWNPRIGAMVALFRNIATGAPQAVSRTRLDGEARKIDRKFLGPTKNAAVMLDSFDSVSAGLHVAEGIETGQAARQLGLRPTWALGSIGAIAKLPVLGGIEALTILAENDGKSDDDVEACAARWHEAGREVLINRPLAGKDLNDAIRSAA